jgi:hypothetical protein
MPFHVPLILGPFLVTQDGALTLRPGDQSPGFHLLWRGRRVDARLDPPAADAAGRLTLQIGLGRIPSTAGGPPARAAARRTRAFGVVAALARNLPPGWRLALRPDHGVAAEVVRSQALPTTAAALIAGLAVLLLELAPYLDVLDEAAPVLELPAASAGRASNWPG